MKFNTAAITLLSAASAIATPSGVRRRGLTSPSQIGANATSSGVSINFILPSIIKSHDISSGADTWAGQTNTRRQGNTELTTLYELNVPAAAAGKTCLPIFYSDRAGDTIQGAQAMDLFSTQIHNLANLYYGNQRDQQLARVKYDSNTGFYDYDTADVPAKVLNFPCSAGQTLDWESVAVGETDVNVIAQDWYFNGVDVPNGFSIVYY